MIVPPESMEQFCRRRASDRFEDCYVSLGRYVPGENEPSYLPCSRTRGAAAAAEQRRPCSCRGDSGPSRVPTAWLRQARLTFPAPRHPLRRLSPLDVALVGQEVIKDAEARGGLQVPEAHGGGARPTRYARPDRHRRGKGPRRACAGLI